MEEALRSAQRALEAGEVPVGAVVVCGGRIVAGDGTATSPTAIRPHMPKSSRCARRGKRLGNHRLAECELFATIEPCPMCAGALVHARINRLIYGADDPKAGAVQSVVRLLNHRRLNHKMEVRGGVLAGRCAELCRRSLKAAVAGS